MNTLSKLNPSFLSNDPALHRVFANALEEDLASATLSWKFKLYYRFRAFVPIFMRQILQRKRNSSLDFGDDWYIPETTMKQLVDAISERPIEIIHPWPDAKLFSFVITHDVETKYGVGLIDKMAKIEEKHGLRSCWNLIPKKYKIDQGLIDDLHQRGFEIGVHGYNHDGRLFESNRTFESRVDYINASADRFGATGFRAPMVHRNLEQMAERLNFEYDASCFDVDPFQAMSGGVGFIWPFLYGDGVVELPYTLPQDHTLFVSLEQRDTNIWNRKLDYLKRNSGMAMLLTHPDYMDSLARLDLYDRFLGECIDSNDGWYALPRDVSDWWKSRQLLSGQLADGAIKTDCKHGKFATATITCEGNEVRIEPVADWDNNRETANSETEIANPT